MEMYGTYQGRWLYSCTFDEILKAYTEKTLEPMVIYAITDRSKVGTWFLYYKGMIVGTLTPAEKKILFYQTRVSFEIWAAKELRGLASSSSQMDNVKIVSERPTVESMCKKEEEVPEVELGISSLAQSLLDGVLGC